MSLESVTLGAARVLVGVSPIKGVYALAGDLANGVLPIPKDIPDAPVVILTHVRLELEPGSFETVRHYLQLDVYLRATEPQKLELDKVRAADAIIAAYRTHTSLFGALDAPGRAGFAVIETGGPINPEEVNEQPFVVYPMIVRAIDAGPVTYSGG